MKYNNPNTCVQNIEHIQAGPKLAASELSLNRIDKPSTMSDFSSNLSEKEALACYLLVLTIQ